MRIAGLRLVMPRVAGRFTSMAVSGSLYRSSQYNWPSLRNFFRLIETMPTFRQDFYSFELLPIQDMRPQSSSDLFQPEGRGILARWDAWLVQVTRARRSGQVRIGCLS